MKSKFLLMLLLTALTTYAQDWANTSKYKPDNARLAAIPMPNRIVLMGDSITEFWKQRDPAFFEDKPYLVNRGIGGQTTPQMLGRFASDVIALKPKVVVILAGTNDIAGNTGPISLDKIMGNIKQMAEMARTHKIKVVLCAVLPAAAFTWNPNVQPASKIIALNKMIKAYADKNHIAYADYYSVTVDANKGLRKEFTGDGVHPNKKGYKVMEPILEAAIK
jgi:lysophospholipase L1-like esterase